MERVVLPFLFVIQESKEDLDEQLIRFSKFINIKITLVFYIFSKKC